MTAADGAVAWECPCGQEGLGVPVRTLVSLMEPACPFCGHKYRDEYRVIEITKEAQ